MNLIEVGVKGIENSIDTLKELNKDMDVVINKTTKDFKQRAPAWVNKGVTEVYNIKKDKVNKALQEVRTGKDKVKIKGIKFNNVSLVYSGKTLTATNFSLTPKTIPIKTITRVRKDVNGKKRKDKGAPYQVKSGNYTLRATIIKGQKKDIGAYKNKRQMGGLQSQSTGGILMPTGAKKEGSTSHIPFQRRSEGHRPPKGLNPFKTLSIPQMIAGEKASGNIQTYINEGISKRFDNHLNQAMKRK